MNILFLLGLALFGGTVGGNLFKKLKIPQVVGYIAIGIFIGESGLRVVGQNVVHLLQPFSYFALGLIGFMIGGELRKDVIVKYGRQLTTILLFEGVVSFLVVALLITVIGTFLFGDWKFSLALGLLLGAIASATAPAATSEVLREYKTRGPLTRTVLGIVALDDALALILFAVAASIVGSLSGTFHGGLLRTFIHPLYEIGVSLAVGIGAGLALSRLLRKYYDPPVLLAFSVGTVLLVSGIALTIHVDMLLASMALGMIVTNYNPRKSKEVFKLVEGFTPPIYVLFFVLVGAKLNIRNMTLPLVALMGVYLIGRSAGKALGAGIGAIVSRAPSSVRKYLPMCLMSQAGVAIGLSILASNYFPGRMGSAIVTIITATTFILEIIGPALVKVAVTKAGEAGLNITDEDIIRITKAKDVMDANPPLIFENMRMADILRIFSDNDNLYYPVVDRGKILRGIITVEGIKQTFLEENIDSLILACDLMENVIATAFPEELTSEIKEKLNRYDIDYLPVINKDDRIEGFIERKKLNKFVSTRIIELQEKASSLDVS
ncbi:MAG: cation:proton antiporter [Candidatus Omnitrophota bacterium]